MKIIRLFIAMCALAASSAYGACTGSSPTWTASNDQASVASCVSSASEGDTINISSGTTTWTSYVTITKALSIIGAGNTSTVIAGTSAAFFINTSSAKNVRISAIGFTGSGGTVPGAGESAKITLQNVIDTVRLDNLKFTDVAEHAIYVGYFDLIPQQPRMLIDHINYSCNTGSVAFCRLVKFECHNSTWTQPDRAGSDWFVFIEDSTLTWTGGANLNNDPTDTEYGCRMVARHNSTTNGVFQVHDTGSTPGARGQRYTEIYNNTIHCSLALCDQKSGIPMRGGGYLVYNNTVTGNWSDPIYVQVYRVGVGPGYLGSCGATAIKACRGAPWYSFYHCNVSPYQGCSWEGGEGPAGCSGQCVLTATSSASCATNEYNPDIDRVNGGSDTSGYPCRDQTGWGQEYDNGKKQWPSPTYFWNNTFQGSAFSLSSTYNNDTWQYNRDGCNAAVTTTTAPDGRTTYSIPACGARAAWKYTPWFYPHPLQSGFATRPSAPTGVTGN